MAVVYLFILTTGPFSSRSCNSPAWEGGLPLPRAERRNGFSSPPSKGRGSQTGVSVMPLGHEMVLRHVANHASQHRTYLCLLITASISAVGIRRFIDVGPVVGGYQALGTDGKAHHTWLLQGSERIMVDRRPGDIIDQLLLTLEIGLQAAVRVWLPPPPSHRFLHPSPPTNLPPHLF